MLRNPTERAISHFFQERRSGRERLPALEAFKAEEERLEPVLEAQDYKNPGFRLSSYKRRGHYLEQIQRFLTCFGRERMLIMNSDLLFTNPDVALRHVCDFVGIDSGFSFENLQAHNVGRNKTDLKKNVYNYLNDYFDSYNQALFKFLGQSYDW